MKNLSLDTVEDKLYRKLQNFDSKISINTLRGVIVQLVELVKRRIATEMKTSPIVALMHDGWTCGGIHYVGVFACYCSQVFIADMAEELPQLTLRSVSPMTQIQDETKSEEKGKEEDEEQDIIVAQFTTEVHVAYFKSVLSYYCLTLQWVVASIADNATTNVKIA